MLQYLINVTNTLFFTMIVIGVLQGIYKKCEGDRRAFVIAVLLGFFTAFVIAVLSINTRLIEREYYNLIVLIPLVIALFCAVFFIGFGSRLVRFCVPIIAFLMFSYALLDILLYPSEFAVGMNTIYNTDFALKWCGYITALAVMIALWYAVYKLALGAPKKALRYIAPAIVVIVALHSLLLITYILLARHIIPHIHALMSIVFFVSDHTSAIFYVVCALTALIAIALLIDENYKTFEGENPAVIRKLKADSRSRKRFAFFTISLLIISILFTQVGAWLNEREILLSPPISVTADQGVIALELDLFNDGHLKRFVYKTDDGVDVRFIVIKKVRGGYGVGFDACEICGESGYYEQEGRVVCTRCDVAINTATIGFRGGCNPIPIAYEITNSQMRIFTQTLEHEKHRFH
ncbi:membrane protein [Campylobacterota bacterium]|nr:membrane protein [Campylobacterota bacterium]